jgi:hypothetical protein
VVVFAAAHSTKGAFRQTLVGETSGTPFLVPSQKIFLQRRDQDGAASIRYLANSGRCSLGCHAGSSHNPASLTIVLWLVGWLLVSAPPGNSLCWVVFVADHGLLVNRHGPQKNNLKWT